MKELVGGYVYLAVHLAINCIGTYVIVDFLTERLGVMVFLLLVALYLWLCDGYKDLTREVKASEVVWGLSAAAAAIGLIVFFL